MHPYHFPYAYPPMGPAMTLVDDIGKAINGQYQAIHYYGQLAKMAPDAKNRQQIMEIRDDEIKHYETFVHLYGRLTGHYPPVTPPEKPRSYEEGLKFAIEDELETVDFYHSIADRAHDPMIREAFRRAAFDEQQHATMFLYKWVDLIRKADP